MHQEQGHECVLVSASMSVYLNAWAKRENFHEIMCTALEEDEEGYVTGRIEGENCHGKDKLRRIAAWKTERQERTAYAYGDTEGDMPMLSAVENGFKWKSSAGCFVSLK